MNKIKKTDTVSAGPINLEPEQLEELDKLIDSLRKEIIFPQSKKERESAVFETSDRSDR